MRLRRSLKLPTWRITESVTATKMIPATGSRRTKPVTRATLASAAPRDSAPASPMITSAGCALNQRKARTAPTIAAQKTASHGKPRAIAMNANERNANTAVPPARPSSPSVRLTPFDVPMIAIIGTSNGVNLTDGLDGLAGGTAVFAFLSFAFIAIARGFPWLAVFCAAIVGAVLAFLWFNAHPAEVIMGDAGALSLGAALASVALVTGFILLLPVAGIIFVAVTLSVILQVGSFKLRRKRIFRMAPLHHHLEALGWPEEKVTIRFWLIGALAGIAAAVLAFATPIAGR